MKVLWSVNTIIPDIAKKMGLRSGHAISWVDAMRTAFKCIPETVTLAIVCHGGFRVSKLTKFEDEGVTYYILPHSCERFDFWKEILNEFEPDVIHIYGTERKHNLILIRKYKSEYPIIISLQGIISEYARHYYAMIPLGEILRNYTIHDLVFRNGIIAGKNSFIRQSKIENEMFHEVDFVEGRSDWDKATVKNLNPKVHYYYCPRMLRSPFYNYKWKAEAYIEHTILVSQGDYPIKGLHFMIEALAILKEKYPDIKLIVAGKDIFQSKWYMEKGYTKIIKNKIKKYSLENAIEFTGYINAEQMAERLSNVNVCVVPSAIENAPNSLAEAMIVGTPCVASYVGGNADMLNNGECGLLYCYYEPQMLAERIEELFDNREKCLRLSETASQVARKRHDPNVLPKQLINIYKEAIEEFIGK